MGHDQEVLDLAEGGLYHDVRADSCMLGFLICWCWTDARPVHVQRRAQEHLSADDAELPFRRM